jgi:hypothetical protein
MTFVEDELEILNHILTERREMFEEVMHKEKEKKERTKGSY